MTEDIPGTLADQVLARLQDEIVSGVFPPGSKVREEVLAARYGVSRAPVREAMRRLEGRHLLEKVPHVGTRVTELSIEELEEVYQAREALEGMASRLAAERMTQEEVAELYALLRRHEQQEDLMYNTAYFQREGDLDFHYRVVQCCHNQALAKLLFENLYHVARMYRYRYSAVDQRPQRALEEHRRIVEAIEARDGELAELLMRRHISRAWENIRTQVGQGGEKAPRIAPVDAQPLSVPKLVDPRNTA
jgi:DNA-binding GntR family transcriptional regulator